MCGDVGSLTCGSRGPRLAGGLVVGSLNPFPHPCLAGGFVAKGSLNPFPRPCLAGGFVANGSLCLFPRLAGSFVADSAKHVDVQSGYCAQHNRCKHPVHYRYEISRV